MRVFRLGSTWRKIEPPRPPSPPSGPPQGTNFSRRKEAEPFPPSPALINIFALSYNMLNVPNSLLLIPTFRQILYYIIRTDLHKYDKMNPNEAFKGKVMSNPLRNKQ